MSQGERGPSRVGGPSPPQKKRLFQNLAGFLHGNGTTSQWRCEAAACTFLGLVSVDKCLGRQPVLALISMRHCGQVHRDMGDH
jgi:hypothetical protein